MRELIEQLRRVLSARPEIQEAYLFGSHARGEAQGHSDVDVAVFAEPSDQGPFGYAADLAADLMTALGRNDVDVVLLDRAPPLLYHRVLTDGVRLFARDLIATTTREGRAISRYCDYVPHLAKLERAFRARAESGGFGR